jgi:hypothetical protein
MRILLTLILLTYVSVTAASAKTYSCVDSSGVMHFSDNLQGLPEECLGKQKEVKQGDPDNLIYVPATPPPQGSGSEFRRSVRAEERSQEKSRNIALNIRNRAEKLLERYQKASQEKSDARWRWRYSARQKMHKANQEIALVLKEKQQLLQELKRSSLTRAEKEEVRSLLADISDEDIADD